MVDGELDIPESNREIALHLRSINTRLTNLEETFSTWQETARDRRFKMQDLLLTGLILPLVGGTILFLLTKGIA